jgi:hypothetical protein
LQGDHDAAFAHYKAALSIATSKSNPDPDGAKLVVRDLAAEGSYVFFCFVLFYSLSRKK